jgi:RNA polymerase sigma-70 factor (ECF subfamily)
MTWIAPASTPLAIKPLRKSRAQGSNEVSDSVEELYERYGPAVHRRARVLLGDEQAAWDALQEVFVRALRSRDRFRHEASPMTWLYRITTNYCFNVLRDRAHRGAKLRQRAAEQQRLAVAGPELRLALVELLQQLPDEVCEMAVYAHVDRMSHDEIAALMGVSPRTVGNRLKEFQVRARVVLGIAVEVAS